jgi:maltooligosyltrehalose trehalohydrolase
MRLLKMGYTSLPQGANIVEHGVHYRIWSPARKMLDVVVQNSGGAVARTVPMKPAGGGYFEATDPLGKAGDLYKISLDGEQPSPPPGSRFQPEGVHGPGEVIDPRTYEWQDQEWRLPAFRDLVIYELHIGTFTEGGTFLSAIEKLPALRDLGVNAIEIMPLADFPGNHGWGYDGVQLFAPARMYGRPDDFRRLVDAAHAIGIGVILDVVYNHFGPDGNYLSHFSPYYFEHEDVTPWGDAINFGRANCEPVREFYKANILYWMEEFHIDGFRLDATHAICDASEPHILTELAEIVHSRGGWIIAEDERNDAKLLNPALEGGHGMDGVWADDFHHIIETALTDASRYKEDFKGTTEELVDVLQHGWTYRGQVSNHTGKPRGTECSDLAPEGFVFCISNHDQVGNRAFGERLHHLSTPAAYRAASALLLLAPYTPLLFMGQEWAASSPFYYFTDHNEELGRLVEEGRQRECRFAAFANGTEPGDIPSPQALATFTKSKLNWQEAETGAHAGVLALYKALLQIRMEHSCFRPANRQGIAFEKLNTNVLAMRITEGDEHWLLLCDLKGGSSIDLDAAPFTAPAEGKTWQRVLSTNEKRFGGNASENADAGLIDFAEPGAVLFQINQ